MKNSKLPPYNITKKQKEYADRLIETGKARESALKTYDCENEVNASNIAYRNSKNEGIKSYINAMLQLNDSVGESVRVLQGALKSKKWVKQEGHIEVEDDQTRMKAAKHILELADAYQQNSGDIHLEKHSHTHFSFGSDVPKSVLEFIVSNQGAWPSEAEYNRLLGKDNE